MGIYETVEKELYFLRQAGFTMNDYIYRILVRERALLEKPKRIKK